MRSFAAEDAAAKHHAAQQGGEELSDWGQAQDKEHRFCRFEPCTWQSFGTRPSARTPHAFEARQLMLRLAQDPGIVSIMRTREYRVGTLAELDPIDDRHAEKMEGEGKRLLGYNTNAGMSIHIRLRTEDLGGFLPYPALVDTLLHELAHNEVGPHNEQFWHLFCQLKADYLRALLALSARGELFGGRSPITLAEAAAEAADVRAAVLGALTRDRQMPASPMQAQLLDGYLAATGGTQAKSAGRAIGGEASAVAASAERASAASALTPAQRRELLAERAAARIAGAGGEVVETLSLKALPAAAVATADSVAAPPAGGADVLPANGPSHEAEDVDMADLPTPPPIGRATDESCP